MNVKNREPNEAHYHLMAHRTCARYCEYSLTCAADPMSCVYYRHLICRRVYGRPGPLLRLAQRLSENRVDAICWSVVLLSLAYFTWHVMAALVEGRLAVPLLR